MTFKKIPTAKGLPILGLLLDYRKDRLKMLLSTRDKYGDIYKLKVGPKTLIVLNKPEYIQHVMQTKMGQYIRKANIDLLFGDSVATLNGENWKKQRMLIQPLFNPNYLVQTVDDIVDLTNKNLSSFIQNENDGTNIRELFSKITFDIILKCIIGLDTYDDYNKIDKAIIEMTNYITHANYKFFKIPKKWNKKEIRFEQSLADVDKILYRGIEKAKKNEDNFSLVSLLSKELDKIDDISDKTKVLRNNLFALLFAGYETSAMSLSWLGYELSQNPEWQKKCIAEAQNFDLSKLNYKDLKIPMIEASIHEAMRMYPAGWAFARYSTEDDDIDGHQIKAGDFVLCSPYITHRDPKLWEKPEEFNPERFIDKSPAEHGRFKFFPFGAGPRICIGKNFGILEMKIILLLVLKEYKFELTGDKPIADARVTLFSKNLFQLKLIKN